MKVLSLFDGMSCGMLAMIEAGQHIDRYVAYEIDKYAIQTSKHNFPDIEQRGDVFNADFTEFEGFDWVMAGFPCTKFSIAQTKDRETKPYSGEGWELFEQAWRAICEARPKYFLLENNKSMAKAVQKEISKIIGFKPICINSALVSAQNRQRLYWVGKRNEDGTYSKVDVQQPEDRGILLKDILECGTADRDKAYCQPDALGNMRDYFKKHHTQVAAEPVNTTKEGKAQTIRATYYKDGIRNMVGNDVDRRTCVAEAVSIKTVDVAMPKIVNKYGYLPEMFNAYNRSEITDKAPTLSTGSMVTSSCAVNKFEDICGYATPIEWDEEGRPTKAISCADGKAYTVYEVKDGKITIKGKTYPIKLVDGFYIIRKLTVIECMRLQTVPEWYVFPVSDSRAYCMLGNGWTVQVISILIKACLE